MATQTQARGTATAPSAEQAMRAAINAIKSEATPAGRATGVFYDPVSKTAFVLFDLDAAGPGEISGTGKSRVLGTTGGFVQVPGAPDGVRVNASGIAGLTYTGLPTGS